MLIYQIDSTLNNFHSTRWALLMYKLFSFMQPNLVFFTSLYWWQIHFHQFIGMQWKVIILCPFALGLLEAHYICLQWSSYCLNGWEMEELVCYCACDSCAREELLLACSGEKKQSLDEVCMCKFLTKLQFLCTTYAWRIPNTDCI